MIPAEYQVFFTLAVVFLTMLTLLLDRFKASLVFLSASAILMMGGALPVEAFISGLSNTSLLTIFLLITITAAINEHFNVTALFDGLFSRTKTATGFLFKMSAGVAGISGFMSNTPVVAMMMPYVHQWGTRHDVNPSKLLMPLSFAAIVGGVITLVGTSTNLVLNGLLASNGQEVLGFFDFLIPGLLISLGSILFLALGAPRILSAHKDILEVFEENKREYLIETRLQQGGSIVGQSIEEAGLRNLSGVFVTAIIRQNKEIVPVGPDEELKADDVLLFAGDTHSIMNLLQTGTGLVLSKEERFSLPATTELLEAVVAQNSVLDRKTVKQVGFRDKYDAAIIGIHRKGEKLEGKIGNLELKTGDLLLLTAGHEFYARNQRHEDLIVINKMKRTSELKPARKIGFWIGALLCIGLVTTGVASLFSSLLLLLFLQVLLGMTDLNSLKRNVSLNLLLVLLSALGMGQALIGTGASTYLTDVLFDNAASWSPLSIMVVVFAVTFVLTSLITNVAAISIIFPVVLSLAASTGLPPKMLYLTAAYAASCCFATPFAYQTNLMVQELGNYRFADYLKLGLPLSFIYALVFFAYGAIAFNLL